MAEARKRRSASLERCRYIGRCICPPPTPPPPPPPSLPPIPDASFLLLLLLLLHCIALRCVCGERRPGHVDAIRSRCVSATRGALNS